MAGDFLLHFMPEMNLRKLKYNFSSCQTFNKNKERIQKFKEKGDSRYIYQDELDKFCFQHDITHGDFKDLPRRTASDKVLRVKAFKYFQTPRYEGYQRGLASMFFKFLDKKSASLVQWATLATRVTLYKCASVGSIKNKNMSNQELAEKLHKPCN